MNQSRQKRWWLVGVLAGILAVAAPIVNALVDFSDDLSHELVATECEDEWNTAPHTVYPLFTVRVFYHNEEKATYRVESSRWLEIPEPQRLGTLEGAVHGKADEFTFVVANLGNAEGKVRLRATDASGQVEHEEISIPATPCIVGSS